MLQNKRQNFHYSNLPDPGDIVIIDYPYKARHETKAIVMAYPLTDSADYHYSYGVHTVYVRILSTGEIKRYGCQWLTSVA